MIRSLLLLLLAASLAGCGVTTQPLRELVPPENVEDLDDPEAPYYKAMSGYSVGSTILAPGDITTVDFGLGAVLGVAEEFDEHVEVRALLAADPTFPLITRAVMALFMVPEFPQGPPDLLKLLDGTPRFKEEIDPDEDGVTFVGTFRVPRDEVRWYDDPAEEDEKAYFLVSVFFETESGIVVREVITARASREPQGGSDSGSDSGS